MKKALTTIFEVAAVFIGTIVGAGLASGQEITQFFTTFGYKSFFGLLICMLMYIFISCIVIDISIKYKLNSYKELIILVSSDYLGKITHIFTSFFIISGAAIIFAGSGALIHQYFGISKWIGILIMLIAAILVLLRETKGLIEINAFIVPSLLFVITAIFILYMHFSADNIALTHIINLPHPKNYWFLSSIIYASFNIMSFCGVIVPFSQEISNKKLLSTGVVAGAIGLTFLSFMLNFMLLLNTPYIFKYEIPLLYIAHRFGKFIQLALLSIIWLEMFSTEVSNIYSVGKTIEKTFNISYKKSVILVILLALPISQIGFKQLINFLYPIFGIVSLIFIIQCCIFYKKDN